jgi:hypothetical protein
LLKKCFGHKIHVSSYVCLKQFSLKYLVSCVREVCRNACRSPRSVHYRHPILTKIRICWQILANLQSLSSKSIQLFLSCYEFSYKSWLKFPVPCCHNTFNFNHIFCENYALVRISSRVKIRYVINIFQKLLI